MSGLHEQLAAAINARLTVARALIAFGPYSANISNARSQALGDAIAAHLVANDPATVTRHCERDLKVLKRHTPIAGGGGTHFWCNHCAITDWPCDEIRDLAAAYGIEVPS